MFTVISEKLGAHVIELPYKGDDISMYILLPSFYDPNGVKYLLEKMTADMISELADPNFMVERPVELAIPKFTVEETLSDLVPVSYFVLIRLLIFSFVYYNISNELN